QPRASRSFDGTNRLRGDAAASGKGKDWRSAVSSSRLSNNRSLRLRGSSNLSLRSTDNVERPRNLRQNPTKRSITTQVTSDAIDLNSDIDELAPTPKKSVRAEIRHQIAIDTMKRRDRFLVAKKDYFLPLLPEHNYIKKLMGA